MPARSAVEADDPARQPRGKGTTPRVILIGWDGADWVLLDRLASSGRMPNWTRLVREGWTARLKSLVPVLSPIVWSSVATGVPPDVHGVLDFQEIDPQTGLAVPISGRSRRVPAVWNVASERGLRVGVVGWWATHPAEEVRGFFISDRASSILFDSASEGLAFPISLADAARRIMAREGEVPDTDLAGFSTMSPQEIHAEGQKEGGLENPVVALKKIIGATRTVQRLARDLYDREGPDFTAVYFEGTDAIGHVFAPYMAPRLPCVSGQDFRRYSGTAEAYYELADRLLGQWMKRASEDGATLVVCSDHGFKWGEDRTCQRSSLNWTTAAFWHRIEGVLAFWGARVVPSSNRAAASVMDIAPTLDALLGLPVDQRMPGKALTEAFRGVSKPSRRDLFTTVTVRRVSMSAPTAAQASEYAAKLRSLGYLSGSESRSLATEHGPWPGWTEGAWNNLGVYQRQTGRLPEAERSFREALRLKPDYASPMFNLAALERERSHWREAIEWLFRSLEAGQAEPEQTLLRWSASLLAARGRPETIAFLQTATSRYPQSEELARELARLRFEAGDCRGSVAALAAFSDRGNKDSLNLLGVSEICLGHREQARGYLERSLAADPAQPPISEALRMIHMTR